MKVLVTGADGLLGSNLVRRLLETGYAVRVLIYPGSTSRSLDGLEIERVEGDLCDTSAGLVNAVQGCEGVFHVAAITDLWADPELTWKVNLDGTRHILDACVAAGVRRVLFVGSASSFEPGTMEQPGDETGGFPEFYRGMDYMESKYQAMELARTYARDGKLDVVVVAPTFLLGPYDTRPSGGELVRRFLEQGMRATSPGGRNFAYAPDVAEGARLAFENGRVGEIYLLAGENLAYQDFFGRVGQLTGRPGPKRVLSPTTILVFGALASFIGKLTGRRPMFNKKIARLSLFKTYYTAAKAVRELGMPKTPVETAICESVRSLLTYDHLSLPYSERFRGKVALITDASQGVGFATARALALRGAKIILTAQDAQHLATARATLEQLGVEVESVVGNVGIYEDAERMAAAARTRFGRLDMVISNAEKAVSRQIANLSSDVCCDVDAANLPGHTNVSRAAIGAIVKTKGHLLFISSVAERSGPPGASTYCTTQSNLNDLSESLRREQGPQGVHVGVVYLGGTEHAPEKRTFVEGDMSAPQDCQSHHMEARVADLIITMLVKRKRSIVVQQAQAGTQ